MQEENATERDLISELDRATETKNPNTSNQNKSWEWGEDEVPISPGAQKTPPAAEAVTQSTSKLSPEKIKSAAVASAAGVEFLTSLVSEGIINLRYFYKFKEEERQKLDDFILD